MPSIIYDAERVEHIRSTVRKELGLVSFLESRRTPGAVPKLMLVRHLLEEIDHLFLDHLARQQRSRTEEAAWLEAAETQLSDCVAIRTEAEALMSCFGADSNLRRVEKLL